GIRDFHVTGVQTCALPISLCNNARLEQTGSGWQVRGDPTEGALLVLAAKAGWNRSAAERMYKREREFPFDSARKRMSVIVRHQRSEERRVGKGWSMRRAWR